MIKSAPPPELRAKHYPANKVIILSNVTDWQITEILKILGISNEKCDIKS
jgi:hypothetical protein